MASRDEVLQEIREAAVDHGVARLERELGWPPGRFYRVLERKHGPYLREVLEIADVLGRTLEIEGPRERWPSAAREFLSEGTTLARKRPTLLPGLARERIPDRLTPEQLQELDELRFTDPHAAVRRTTELAAQAAREGRVGDAARLMARQAAARRLCPDPRGAHICLAWAIRQLPDEPELWLRASYLVSDYGEFEDALELASWTLAEYADRGDVAGVARCALQRARLLYRLGDSRKAIQGFEATLRLLPAGMGRHRAAAHQNLGLALVEAGRLEEAEEHAECAAEIGRLPRIEDGRLTWLRARLAAERRRIEDAVDLYRRTIELLEPSPNNAAVATCELVRLLLEAGEAATAAELARGTARFLQPGGNRIVVAALLELINAALEGREHLEVSLLNRVIAKISRETGTWWVGQLQPAQPD